MSLKLEDFIPDVKYNGTVTNKAVRIASETAVTSGGSTNGLQFGPTTGPGIYFGTGSPTISAAQGSLYLNVAGSSSSTRAYINSTGSTTWVAVTTAS